MYILLFKRALVRFKGVLCLSCTVFWLFLGYL